MNRIFPVNGDAINLVPESVEEFTIFCLYRLNQPLCQIHGIT